MTTKVERAIEITFRLAQAWQGERPRFTFPSRRYVVWRQIDDVAEQIARNDPARRLVALIVDHCAKIGISAPPARVLEVVLQKVRIPIERVPLSDFDNVERKGERL